MPPFWPLTEEKAFALKWALMGFAPRPGMGVMQISDAWGMASLASLVGIRRWMTVATLSAGDLVSFALSRMKEQFRSLRVPPDASHRGALLIPNGQYRLTDELNLIDYPYFDLIGESREKTILTYGGPDNRATIYAKGYQGMIAHMTVERTGSTSDVAYAIHDNTPAATPRTTLFVDLDCKTAPGCVGIGTGIAAGGLHLYCGVNADNGFFAHNGDEIREAHEAHMPSVKPADHAALIYLDCTAGLKAPVSARFGTALTYWNCGSGQPDILALCGGEYHGASHGLAVIDYVPFSGRSETVVHFLHEPILTGATRPYVLPEGTRRITEFSA
jgi:hypothetical protein